MPLRTVSLRLLALGSALLWAPGARAQTLVLEPPVVWGAAGLVLVLLALLWRSRARVLAELRSLRRQEQAQREASELEQRQRRLVVEIGEQLQRAASPEDLARHLLAVLAPVLDLGAALMARWDAAGGRPVPLARWAGAGADLAEVAAGSLGLLQECGKRAEPMLLQGEEARALRVQSGLGWMEPQSLLLQPVRHGGQVHAVLELATLRPLNEADRRLLSELEPLIALSLALQLRVHRGEGGHEAGQWLQDLPLALTVHGEGGEPIYASPAFLQMMALTSGNLGHARQLWVQLDEHRRFQKLMREHGQVHGFEAELMRGDGRQLLLDLDASWSQHHAQRCLITVYQSPRMQDDA